jgi:polysaccharide biosynthesis/export protein
MAVRQVKISSLLQVIFLIYVLAISPLGAGTQEEFLLGPEDQVEIVVWDNPDLSLVVAVSTAGTINFPLIGTVTVAGLSSASLADLIKGKLAHGFLVNPQVSVSVKEFKSQRVYVMGEVRNPGSYAIPKQNDLLSVLALAGGPAPNAGQQVLILRPSKPTTAALTVEEAQRRRDQILTANIRGALEGDSRQNIVIRNGDTVFVEKSPVFYVTGEVKNPGKYNLEPGTTVREGVSVAGGLTLWAREKRIKIIREAEGSKQEIPAGLDTKLAPGDSIFIPN